MEDKTPSSGLRPASPVAGGATHVDNSQDCIETPSTLEEGAQNTLAPGGRGCHEVTGEGDTPKQQLRKWAKEERKKLNTEKLSQALIEKLKKTEEYKKAKNIMIFYPLKDEINLLALTEDGTKNFFLPKIQGQELLCCPFNSETELCESCFKTKEPLSESVNPSLLDLVILPALAIDKKNYRLGYGGGFYDRFLAKNNVYKIVCIAKEFCIETIQPELYDIPVDKVIIA